MTRSEAGPPASHCDCPRTTVSRGEIPALEDCAAATNTPATTATATTSPAQRAKRTTRACLMSSSFLRRSANLDDPTGAKVPQG